MTILNVPEAVAIAATPGSEESALVTETLILVIRENIYTLFFFYKNKVYKNV